MEKPSISFYTIYQTHRFGGAIVEMGCLLVVIKIVRRGLTSDWEKHTKRKHRALMKKPPDAVIIRLQDFYPDTYDAGEYQIPFPVFNALARDFVLLENRLDKRESRHGAGLLVEDLEEMDGFDCLLGGNVADEYEVLEIQQEIRAAVGKLSASRFRRVYQYYYWQLTHAEIAGIEGITQPAVCQTLKVARKKIKRILKKSLYFCF